MENNQSAMMVKRSSTPSQVRSKPAKLKTIHQLQATDRPTEVKALLQTHSENLLLMVCECKRKAKSVCPITPGDAAQLIRNIGRLEQAIDAWTRDVTATATEIAAKWQNILHEDVTLRVR